MYVTKEYRRTNLHIIHKNYLRSIFHFFALTLLLSGLAPDIVYADQATTQGWSAYTTVGKFLYSEPPKPDMNFIIKYRVLNGTMENFTATQGDFKAKVSALPQTNGTLEIMVPRNYPYTNQVGIVGGAKLAIILFNGTESSYYVMTNDCFFDYSVSFSGNEKIELTFPYLVSKLSYHGDEVSPNCIGQTISQNFTQNVNSTVPEFSLANPILLVSFASLILLYRAKIRN